MRAVHDGVDLVVFADRATAVQLCLFDGEVERRVELFGPRDGYWHAHVPGVAVGTRYGLRADGPWDPASGRRYNPAKLLLDPYARALDGQVALGPELFSHRVDENLAPIGEPTPDERDSAPFTVRGVVTSDDFDWGSAERPQIDWRDTVLYEAHVRGLTMLHPEIPPELRGTYAGVAHPATIAHLTELGITTVELLPIHACLPEPSLTGRGLTNYWGYNTLGFFAPEPRYASAAARAAGPAAVVAEVKGMIRLLHEAGLEVVLDVVYNHTCEGGTEGPTLSWRGLDPLTYYLHEGSAPARFADVTGCGNSLNFLRVPVVAMALDSLRHWATEYRVDGFRYDLAVTLGRNSAGFDPDHPFWVALRTDPVLAGLKHIAEPWDLGPGGWRTGDFPAPIAAWNDQFRNAVRSFWLTSPAEASHGRVGTGVRELATRLSGSADVFGGAEVPWSRGPNSSVNFVTAHDGFTMADLVTYDHKANQANGEDNRDGTDDNRSWNHGVEGPVPRGSAADAVLPLRRRSLRNLMATLVLSAGMPMITAGDEFGRTQHGNNNAYCQDNEISWIDWELTETQADLLATTRWLLRLRRRHAALHPQDFFTGLPLREGQPPDLAWFDAAANPMGHDQWLDAGVRTLQMLRAAPEVDMHDVLLVVNGSLDPQKVVLPDGRGTTWTLVWDSVWESPEEFAAETEEAARSTAGGEAASLDPLVVRLYLSEVTAAPPTPAPAAGAQEPDADPAPPPDLPETTV